MIALAMICSVAAADPVTGIYDNFDDGNTDGWDHNPIIANLIDTNAKPIVIAGRLSQSTLTAYRSDWMVTGNDYIGTDDIDVAFRGSGSVNPWGGIGIELLAPDWPGDGTFAVGYSIELYGERHPRVLQIVRTNGPVGGTLIARYDIGTTALADHDYRIERRDGAWRAWQDGVEMTSAYGNFDATYNVFPYVGVNVGARPGGFDWLSVRVAAPEPSALVLLLVGAAGIGLRRRRTRSRERG